MTNCKRTTVITNVDCARLDTKKDRFRDIDLSWLDNIGDDIIGINLCNPELIVKELRTYDSFMYIQPNVGFLKYKDDIEPVHLISLCRKKGSAETATKLMTCYVSDKLKSKIVPTGGSICDSCIAFEIDSCVKRLFDVYDDSMESILRDNDMSHSSVHYNCTYPNVVKLFIGVLQEVSKTYAEGNIIDAKDLDNSRNELTELEQEIKQVKPVKQPKVKKPVERFKIKQVSDDKYSISFEYGGKKTTRMVHCKSIDEANVIATELGHKLDDESYTLTNVEAVRIYSRLSGDTKTYDELLDAVEAELATYESEVAMLKEELAKAKDTINVKDQIIASLSNKNSISSMETDTQIEELYDGELDYQLHKAVEFYLQSHSDGNRGKDILTQFSMIPYTDKRKEIQDALVNLLRSDSIHSSNFKSVLSSLGLDIEPLGNGHRFIFPKGHKEYGFTFSSSPSDNYRGPLNAVTAFMKMLFN